MNTTAFKKLKLGLISLSTFAILAACGNDGEQMPDTEEPQDNTETPAEDPADTGSETENQTDEEENETGTDTTNNTETATEGILSMTFQISFEDAVQTFRDTFGESVNIEEVEFDEDSGQYYYEIEGWEGQNEYKLEINAENGEVRKESTRENQDPDDDILEIEKYITPEEAMKAAVDSSTTDFVEEWTLEFEDGRPVYDIDLKGAEDVEVDAETGEVL